MNMNNLLYYILTQIQIKRVKFFIEFQIDFSLTQFCSFNQFRNRNCGQQIFSKGD